MQGPLATGASPASKTSAPLRCLLWTDPFLAAGADEFVCRLTDHPSVDLLTVYCQGDGTGWRARLRDLWRRRRWLALPLAAAHAARQLYMSVFRPASLRRRRRALAALRVVPSLHAPDVAERVRQLKPQLGLVYGGPILKPELFGIPELGTLGIHHGRMPEYRGKKTTFWEILNGESEAGITIQRIDAGIDTGGVVARAAVPIGRRSYRRIWKEVQAVGVDLFTETVARVAAGQSLRATESSARGPLYRDPTPSQLLLLWFRRRRRDPARAASRLAGDDGG